MPLHVSKPSSLIIACGALAQEITMLKKMNAWDHIAIECLPAHLHNTPSCITPAVENKIMEAKNDYKRIFVAYADCGTAGDLSKVLKKFSVEQLPGPHCYACFTGINQFEKLQAQEPGTFYLTDFLLTHFERLVIKNLGIDQYPELKNSFFGNYKRLVYLAQRPPNTKRLAMAQRAAKCLRLRLSILKTGYGSLEYSLKQFVKLQTVSA
jgi:hypothetical protein